MERKKNPKEGSSPRGFSDGEDDVFDFPGVEDEGSGSGPVPREAHVALREAFKSLKQRYLEAKSQKAELQAKLKQRDKKRPHSRVYQERDELQSLLQKSYLAFQEKYGENEELKKVIQELKEELRLSQGSDAQGEGSTGPSSSSDTEEKSFQKKYTAIIKEFKAMGLEVIEENEQEFVILTDRDVLKKWIEEKADGRISVVYRGNTFEDKASETDGMLAIHKGYEQAEDKRKGLEAEVILLKRKIQDQAEELGRFYKVFKEVMEQNLRLNKQKERAEGGSMQQGLPNVAQRITTQTGTALRQKAESMLANTREQVAEIRQVTEHLDKQNKSLRTLIDLQEKTTEDFLQSVGAPTPREVSDSPGVRATSDEGAGAARPFAQGQRRIEGNFERAFADDAPLSIAIQETEMRKLKSTGANAEFSSEAMANLRLSGSDGGMAPTGAFSTGLEGRAVSMATAASETTWTGESDIEVIEEEEDFIGATSSRGKLCPVCECFFPSSYDQYEFERHVQRHFDDDA